MGRRVVGLLGLALWSAACGAGGGLGKIQETVQVAGGGLDTSLLGTFRLDAPDRGKPGMLKLLVLRADGAFHAEIFVECDKDPCPVTDMDGVYHQVREFPNPTRASGVELEPRSFGRDPGLPFVRMVLKRALVANSPQVSMYHPAAGDLPFFQLIHPFELWCADVEDCDAQDPGGCLWACPAGTCTCPP